MEYDPLNGIPIRDGSVDKSWTSIVDCFSTYKKFEIELVQPLRYATENIFYRARIALVRGEIDELVFIFQGLEIPVNPDGTINYWPKGFCDISTNLVCELLDAKYERKNA